jgi:pimeloyl-ACP methyl ester carboxylesterase
MAPVPLPSMNAIDALGLPESRWVDVNGPVHYREWPGPAGGPTFVLVHGLGGSLLNWALVAPGVARHGRVLAMDLAGFGLTPAEGRSSSITANWRLLDGFLRAVKLPPVIMVGNSMGGMLTLIQSAHAPETIERMILVDAAFPRARLGSASQPAPRVALLFGLYATGRVGERLVSGRARRLGAEGLLRETLRVCTTDPSAVDPALVEALIDQARRRMEVEDATPAFLTAARSIFRSQAFPAKYRELVRQARTPALVVHGADDRLIPVASAEAAVRGHENWRLEILDGLGHIPQMEAPARWLEVVERWLEEYIRADDRPSELPA